MYQLSIPESTPLPASQFERNPHSGHMTRFHLTLADHGIRESSYVAVHWAATVHFSHQKNRKRNQEFFLFLIVVVHAFHPSIQEAEAGGPM